MIHGVQVNFILSKQQLEFKVKWEIEMPNINRRRLLKAISAASAAAAVPVGVSAAAKLRMDKHTAVYIDIRHSQYKGSATRQIINQGNKPLVLNGYQPVTIRHANGDYTSLHLNTPNTLYTLQPGEQLPVYAQAVMTTSPASTQLSSNQLNNNIAII